MSKYNDQRASWASFLTYLSCGTTECPAADHMEQIAERRKKTHEGRSAAERVARDLVDRSGPVSDIENEKLEELMKMGDGVWQDRWGEVAQAILASGVLGKYDFIEMSGGLLSALTLIVGKQFSLWSPAFEEPVDPKLTAEMDGLEAKLHPIVEEFIDEVSDSGDPDRGTGRVVVSAYVLLRITTQLFAGLASILTASNTLNNARMKREADRNDPNLPS